MTTPASPAPPLPPAAGVSAQPELWNPNAAACWCLLFSLAFGAYLHARNAEALGRTDEAKTNQRWFEFGIAFLVLHFVTFFIPSAPHGWLRIVNTILLLTWYFTLGKKQVHHVQEAMPGGYLRRPWRTPLLIGFGCLMAVFVASFIFQFTREMK